MEANKVDDALVGKYLQELYDRDNCNDMMYCFPSEGTVPQSSYRKYPSKREQSSKDRPINDELVAKYLQELYDNDYRREIDENIYYLPSEGTVPRSNYRTPDLLSLSYDSNDSQPSSIWKTTREIFKEIVTDVSETMYESFFHVAPKSSPTISPEQSETRNSLEQWTEMEDFSQKTEFDNDDKFMTLL